MILGQLPLRAKPSHVEAEPGGSRGTVVIVRTRVGFGVSLVGGGARVQVFERSRRGRSDGMGTWRTSGGDPHRAVHLDAVVTQARVSRAAERLPSRIEDGAL